MQLLSLSSSQRVAARSILAILGAAMLVSACSRPAPPEEPVRSVKVITVGLGAFEYWQPLNCSRAQRELGMQARPPADTLRDALRWYTDHGSLTRTMPVV
jgi:nucleoside-diphosphate-sugar epimerase